MLKNTHGDWDRYLYKSKKVCENKNQQTAITTLVDFHTCLHAVITPLQSRLWRSCCCWSWITTFQDTHIFFWTVFIWKNCFKEFICSRLSLYGHFYKMDTSIKQTPRAGPCLLFVPLLDSK